MKKFISAITLLALAFSLGLAACGKTEEEHSHSWAVENSAATCGEAGVTEYKCDCGETKAEETSASGNHTFGSGKVCSVCGYINFGNATAEEAIAEYGYYVEDKDSSNTYSTGDIAYFGSYPQNEVKDGAVISTLPEEGGWTDYGYYSNGEQSAYAYYKDVTVNNKKYRGVRLEHYRPYYSGLAAGTEYSYIDDEGYELNTVYWFEYAPVQWNVLSYSEGSLFLSSKYSLEAQPFQDVYQADGENFVIPETDISVNNYKESSLRGFLNGSFYETAFSELQQSFIQSVTLDNASSGYSATAEYQINQKDTQDRVFLLSYADVNNSSYGYSSKGSTRVRSYTDYSVIQGLRTSTESQTADGEPACSYILRSAGSKSYGLCGVSKNGSVSYNTSDYSTASVDGLAINGDLGVLPALYIRVGKAAQGVWKDFTYEYTNGGGQTKDATCSVYVPASYTGGTKLPLITYIADASYENVTLEKYKTAECPTAWLTEEKTSKSPAFMLITCGSPSATLINSLIDKVVGDYGIDTDRLYLTGQSMGGICDFLINDTYPDKFAATVYVDCQPGGEVHDEQYDAIIASANFAEQKFVYIASRKDEKASQGQDDVEQVLIEKNSGYGKLYGIDHTDVNAYNAAIKVELDKGLDRYFFGFTQLTKNGNTAAEHNASFAYGYSVDAIFEWLLSQHK